MSVKTWNYFLVPAEGVIDVAEKRAYVHDYDFYCHCRITG